MGPLTWTSLSFSSIKIRRDESFRGYRMGRLKDRLPRISLGEGGEFDLIRRLIGPEEALLPGVLIGPGDDCTVLEGGLVVSTDLTVEGVHFRRDWLTPEEVGFRATAAALSDVAAMAAEPVGVLLSMALDPSRAAEEAVLVQAGAQKACRGEGIQILGGDLAGSPGGLVLNVVALGRSESPILRNGTQAGDEIWVTGVLGGSGAAVALLEKGMTLSQDLRMAFASPRPRMREALWLATRVPLHGLIDLSDGLAGDAGHLAAASHLSLVLRREAIPCHPALTAKPSLFPVLDSDDLGAPLHFALEGGEDYELCFTVPPGVTGEWVGPFREHFGIPLTKVGRVTEGSGVFLESSDGEISPLTRTGFSHFPGKEEG